MKLTMKENVMTLQERTQVEDVIDAVLQSLTRGEKAIFYKTLYAQGFKISDCDDIVRKEPPPEYLTVQARAPSAAPSRVYLSRGLPPLRTW
jgi:hypothetical protein